MSIERAGLVCLTYQRCYNLPSHLKGAANSVSLKSPPLKKNIYLPPETTRGDKKVGGGGEQKMTGVVTMSACAVLLRFHSRVLTLTVACSVPDVAAGRTTLLDSSVTRRVEVASGYPRCLSWWLILT